MRLDLCSCTNLCDEHSELVEVAVSFCTGPQLANHSVEPLSSLHRVLNVVVETCNNTYQH